MCLLVKATLILNSHKYYFLLQMEFIEWNALISLSLYYFFNGSSSIPRDSIHTHTHTHTHIHNTVPEYQHCFSYSL